MDRGKEDEVLLREQKEKPVFASFKGTHLDSIAIYKFADWLVKMGFASRKSEDYVVFSGCTITISYRRGR